MASVTPVVHDPFVAVETSTDLRSHALELRRRWDASFVDGATTEVRDVIADSWSRMRGAGLDPVQLQPTAATDDDALAAAREASPLRWCLGDLRGALADMADDAQHIMVVSDAAGTLLWIEGHGRVLEQARGIDFVEGMNWTERSAGTNAIGTALAIDHAVQIFSAEHFLPEQHPWWCSAAPIHHPVTGDLLGIVDLSGPQGTAHPHSLALVKAAAAIAEQTLVHRLRRRAATAETPSLQAGSIAVAPAHQEPALARIELLTPRPTVARPGQSPERLSLRQAEVVALLAMHDQGLTAEQLTLHLYGDGGNPVTTRALVSRLREVVGDVVLARPYRLADGVHVDVRTVRRLLSADEGRRAVAMYPGPLLPTSEVNEIERVRREIDLGVRAVAMHNGPDVLWRWLDTPTGSEDLEAVERFLSQARPDDLRRPMAITRHEAITRAWDG